MQLLPCKVDDMLETLAYIQSVRSSSLGRVHLDSVHLDSVHLDSVHLDSVHLIVCILCRITVTLGLLRSLVG